MSNFTSFDQLWEACESFHSKDLGAEKDPSLIIEEVLLKIKLYKILDEKKINNENIEIQKMKTITFGEILFSLANLSLKDEINIFKGLNYVLETKQKE